MKTNIVQSTEYRVQSTEYRIQNTEYRIGHHAAVLVPPEVAAVHPLPKIQVKGRTGLCRVKETLIINTINTINTIKIKYRYQLEKIRYDAQVP